MVEKDGKSSGKLLRFQSGVLGSTLLALKPKNKISDIGHYIYFELMEHRTGSAIPHIDKDYLLNLKAPILPQTILEKFCSLVEPIFQKLLPIRNKSWF